MIGLQATNDIAKRISIGKEVVAARKEIYMGGLMESIYNTINFLRQKSANLPFSDDEIFYLSVYDYWMYGFTIEEEFYLNLFNKSEEEKQEYISHMDRINYMHYLNNQKDEHILTNKYETYKLLKEYYGRDVIYVQSESDAPVFKSFFDKHESFVIKPVGMATSIGVKKVLHSDCGDDADSALRAILLETRDIQSRYKWASGNGVIIEEVIQQGEELKMLHPASINSVRLTTIRNENDVICFYPVLRIGMGGEFLCCGAVGSILTGINAKTGISETEGFNEWNQHYSVHPNTGMPIKGIAIPKWDELCELAKELSCKLPTIRYIGWDFVYSSDKNWIVMEANENGEFLGQIAYQKGVLKEFQSIINWKSPKEYWWYGKYSL